MIITIDGPAGSGKSSVAVRLAQRLNLPHLDTGAMYRAIALYASQNHLLNDPHTLVQHLHAGQAVLRFDWSTRPAHILLNGQDVSELIRTPEVTKITRFAADNPGIRAQLVTQQRQIASDSEHSVLSPQSSSLGGGVVTEGRDQGSVVFPDAPFKFYLDAKPDVRAQRRLAELQAKGHVPDPDQLLKQLIQRDLEDQSRTVGALCRTPDSILIDTSDLTLEQVVDTLQQIVTTGVRP